MSKMLTSHSTPAFRDIPADPVAAALASEQFLVAARRFLKAYGSNDTSLMTLLSFFSSTHPVSIQHCPAVCTNPAGSLLIGANAVRSYFDLIATHWKRSNLVVHSTGMSDQSCLSVGARKPISNIVVISASIMWTWRRSGKGWTENFMCALEFDEQAKITAFTVTTQGEPGTCVMRAVDTAWTLGLQGQGSNLHTDHPQL